MNKFSKASLNKLHEAHFALQMLANEVIKHADCTITSGYRGEEEQNRLFYAVPRLSKSKYPDSKHNILPSHALDIAPFVKGDVDYNKEQCYFFAGIVRCIANQITEKTGIKFRWGGDWNSDGDIKDQTFNDLVHWEIVS